MTDLDHLVVVQEHDSALDRLRRQRATLPARADLHAAEAGIAAIAPGLSDLRNQRDVVARDAHRLDDEVASVREKSAGADKSLYSGKITAIKELQALQTEIDQLAARQGVLEERELELMQMQETLEAEVAVLEAQSKAHGDVAAGARVEIAAGETALDAQIAEALEARTAEAYGLPDALLATYELVRGRGNGVGIARLVGNTCQGCRLSIPATEIDRIRRGIPGESCCDNCGAILVP